MKKRILSIVLAFALVLSMAAVGIVSVSAAETDAADSSADKVFYFNVPDFWITDDTGLVMGDAKTSVYCHVFTVSGSDPDFEELGWQVKSSKCTYVSGNTYVFDTSKLKSELKDNCDYAIIFSAKSTTKGVTIQSYDLTMGTSCYGDIVYVTEQTYENPQDSAQICNAAYWTNPENAAIYGPHAGITSKGVLQGEVYAPGEDKAVAIANFIIGFTDNATTENVAALCQQLNVEPYYVYKACEANATEATNLEAVAGLLGLSYPPQEPTTEPESTEPESTEPESTEPETTEPPAVPTRCVAGDQALTGVAWDAASNQMTYADGLYTITFTGIAAGSYGFKVTDGTWDNSWGDGESNYTITLSKTADVTITFNDETKEIGVTTDPEDALSDWQLEYITAVGNGDGAWLNGVSNWDPAAEANKMTEVTSGVWEITFENVEAYDNYNVKFACNGSWQPYNWNVEGVLDGQDNAGLIVDADGTTVTLRIDVNGFNFETGEGDVKIEMEGIHLPVQALLGDVDSDGELTIKDASLIQLKVAKLLSSDVSYNADVEDYTQDGKVNILDAAYVQLDVAKLLPPPAPTQPESTEPESTQPESTEPESTEPESTQPETTEPPVSDAHYFVAGDETLVGVNWEVAGSEMDANGDGTYSVTYYAVPAGSYGFKITNGTWDVQWGKDGVKDTMSANYTITLTEEADVTITLNPALDTDAITVTTDPESALGQFQLSSITAVGNGDGNWLNGASWSQTDLTNDMVEIEDGIWEIEYTNVDDYDNYNLKFACNHAWQPYNWGVGSEVVSENADGSVTVKGVFDLQNHLGLIVDEPGTTVTLTLDVRSFDFDAGTGDVYITLKGIHL